MSVRRRGLLWRGGSGSAVLERCREAVSAVNAFESVMRRRSDADLRAATSEFKARLAAGEDSDALLPEAFAAVREAASRSCGLRPVDEQIMGGAALHLGVLAEMKTGEGKTLTITLPAYLNALTGRGVHVVTANEYLAARDAQWMEPVYRALGLTCGLVTKGEPVEPTKRRAAYAADITYSDPYELAYDYLRDNGAWEPSERVQRGHYLAIVDEADLILVDETRKTSHISTRIKSGATEYSTMVSVVDELVRERHYTVDEDRQLVTLTDAGIVAAENLLGLASLYESADDGVFRALDNALRAKEVFRRDRDYVVANGTIEIVDTKTGRAQPGTVFGGGLDQAIQAREGLTVEQERMALASISTREYLRQYERLTAVTGVATESSWYQQAYGLETVRIATHLPIQRLDRPPRFFASGHERLNAVVAAVAKQRAAGRPVLIGTASIAQSEQVSEAIEARGIPHEVLNAKNHEAEAQIIARAGRIGAVTVVTRMAGRGVDIRLGGADPEERDAVVRAGGLYVLAMDVYETRRLELHMRGRAGRRGDPGESALFLALDDQSLLSLLGPKNVRRLRSATNETVDSSNRLINRVIERALDNRTAWQVERLLSEVKYDDAVGEQRDEIYRLRQRFVEDVGVHDWVRASLDEVTGEYVAGAAPGADGLRSLWDALAELYPISITAEELAAEYGHDPSALPRDTLTATVRADARRAYGRREAELGESITRELERRVVLSVIDRNWREHLQYTTDLLGSVTLHGLTGSDHLARYRTECTRQFSAMQAKIKEEAVGYFFNLEVEIEPTDQP